MLWVIYQHAPWLQVPMFSLHINATDLIRAKIAIIYANLQLSQNADAEIFGVNTNVEGFRFTMKIYPLMYHLYVVEKRWS